MAKPGPKVPDIDAKLVENMASWGCKTIEIANYFGVSVATIDRRFVEELVKGRANLQMSLRRKQIDIALKGNVTMLIWLGKQMLDQKDKHEMSSDEEKGFVMHIKDYAEKKKSEK
jgi:hypothetical protein